MEEKKTPDIRRQLTVCYNQQELKFTNAISFWTEIHYGLFR